MAISYDTQSSGTGSNTTTHNHTVAVDADLALVGLSLRDVAGSVQAATGVTIGGEAMTLVTGGGVTQAGGVMRTELWYRLAPPTGVQSVVATAHASTDVMVTGVITLKGVAQSSTFGAVTTATSASSADMDVNSIASALGDLVVLCGASRGAVTHSADGTAPTSTERVDASHTIGPDATSLAMYTEDGAATSTDMRVNISAAVQFAALGVAVKPAENPTPSVGAATLTGIASSMDLAMTARTTIRGQN